MATEKKKREILLVPHRERIGNESKSWRECERQRMKSLKKAISIVLRAKSLKKAISIILTCDYNMASESTYNSPSQIKRYL